MSVATWKPHLKAFKVAQRSDQPSLTGTTLNASGYNLSQMLCGVNFDVMLVSYLGEFDNASFFYLKGLVVRLIFPRNAACDSADFILYITGIYVKMIL